MADNAKLQGQSTMHTENNQNKVYIKLNPSIYTEV